MMHTMQDARSNWAFDMIELDAATEGHSLSCYSFWLLQVSQQFWLKLLPGAYSLPQPCLIYTEDRVVLLNDGDESALHMCVDGISKACTL